MTRYVRWLIYLSPMMVFAVMVMFFLVGLGKDPREVKPVLIDVAVPSFSLPALSGDGGGLSSDDLRGRVSLVNIFGSWCVACIAEHPMLLRIRESGIVPLYGINWRDRREDAIAWLGRHGNPYEKIGIDPDSRTAIDFGVTGAPESFVIDAGGVIRYKWTGPITEEVWKKILLPLITELSR